jgi:hypothetical protein
MLSTIYQFMLKCFDNLIGEGKIPPIRPKYSTGTLQPELNTASLNIVNHLSGTHFNRKKTFYMKVISEIALEGKGQSVIGRKSPTFIPFSRPIQWLSDRFWQKYRKQPDI